MFRREELESDSRVRALLVHVTDADLDQGRPNLRGEAIIWAATYLTVSKWIPHLVFAGHHFYKGNDRLPVGLITAQESERHLKKSGRFPSLSYLPTYPEKKGKTEVMRPVTETSGEVIAFLAFCDMYGISSQNVASVASDTHVPRIKELYRARGAKAQVFSAEEVLLNVTPSKDVEYYASVVEQIATSEEERRFKKSERIKRLLQRLPFGLGEKAVRDASERQREVSSYPRTWQTIRYTFGGR